MFWDAVEWHSSILFFYIHIFNMVEEKFDIWLLEMLQIESILLFADNNYFTMVEENFLKRSRLTQFYYLLKSV